MARHKAYRDSPLYQANKETVMTKEMNDKVNKVVIETMMLPRLDYDDVEGMERRILEYLEICDKYETVPGNFGLYNALGIHKSTADDWERGTKGPQFADLIKKAKAVVAQIREARMAAGQLNVVAGIFWQKNFDGLSDKQEISVSTAADDYDVPAEELRDKYIGSVGEPLLEQKD